MNFEAARSVLKFMVTGQKEDDATWRAEVHRRDSFAGIRSGSAFQDAMAADQSFHQACESGESPRSCKLLKLVSSDVTFLIPISSYLVTSVQLAQEDQEKGNMQQFLSFFLKKQIISLRRYQFLLQQKTSPG